jgi:hypothetical protein
MANAVLRVLAGVCILLLSAAVCAQDPGTRAPDSSRDADAGMTQPAFPVPDGAQAGLLSSGPAPASPAPNLLDRFLAAFSQQEDRDGPINTDRPTFTPANTVVPRGRLQFESGWTFNTERSGATHTQTYDFPELAMRYGLADRVEFRMFWLGQTDSDVQAPRRRPRRPVSGPSDMEVGFKWQLFPGDKERKWIPTTALITSIFAPTGGSDLLSSETVEPYINLIYAWNLTDKLTFGGSTGYIGERQHFTTDSGFLKADNLQRYHQSIVAFYAATERTTLFYEWYVFMFTNSHDNRPLHFMDGGIIYHLTPNIQVDIRAGFGLSGRPDDFFTGTGFSIRF